MAIRGTKLPNSSLNKDRRITDAVVRSANIPAGHTKQQTADELKNILGIEGDAVGTLNTQELFNKTTDGGFF
jgi:hypothetical protein